MNSNNNSNTEVKTGILVLCNPQKAYATGMFATEHSKEVIPYLVSAIGTPIWDSIYFQMDAQNFGQDSDEYSIIPEINKALGESPCKVQFGSDKNTAVSIDMIRNIKYRTQNMNIGCFKPSIFVEGYLTDVTVLSTALMIHNEIPDAFVTVNTFACSGTNKEDAQNAYTLLKNNGIEVL